MKNVYKVDLCLILILNLSCLVTSQQHLVNPEANLDDIKIDPCIVKSDKLAKFQDDVSQMKKINEQLLKLENQQVQATNKLESNVLHNNKYKHKFRKVVDNLKSKQKLPVFCYVYTTSPKQGFTSKLIDPMLCTHIVFAFLVLNETTFKAEFDGGAKDSYIRNFVEMRKMNPNLKFLIAVGGYVDSNAKAKYSNMVSDKNHRNAFIRSTLNILRKYRMNGLVLFWQYPGATNGRITDKETLVLLMKELQVAYASHDYLVCLATAALHYNQKRAYDFDALQPYVDYFHMITFEYYGRWSDKTGFNAPLYQHINSSKEDKIRNIENSVATLLQNGLPSQKLVMGLPLFAKTFYLERSSNNGIYADTIKDSFLGPQSRTMDLLWYNEVCTFQSNEEWTIVWDAYQQGSYMYDKYRWVSFEDSASIAAKMMFIQELNMGGVFVFTLESDDSAGECGQMFPLSNYVNKYLDAFYVYRPK